jgi:hypothetical protein
MTKIDLGQNQDEHFFRKRNNLHSGLCISYALDQTELKDPCKKNRIKSYSLWLKNKN